MRNDDCPPVTLNSHQIPQENEAKYLALRAMAHEAKNTFSLTPNGIKIQKMFCLMGKQSKYSLENKVLLYST